MGIYGSRKILVIVFLSLFSFGVAVGSEKNESTQKNQTTQHVVNEGAAPRPWWLGDVITILGVFSASSMILVQLSQNQKNALKIQKENYRGKHRLEIYQEFSKFLEKANKKTVNARIYSTLIPIKFRAYISQANSVGNPVPLDSRVIGFSQKKFSANRSINNLTGFFEKYEIISPGLYIFRVALNSANYDIQEAFEPLYNLLLEILPMDILNNDGTSKLANVIIPTQKQMNQLDQLVSEYQHANDTLLGYLFDSRVELQNIFLSSLFDNVTIQHFEE